MEQKEIKAGMTLWQRETDMQGNSIGITNVEVASVGKKYFYLDEYKRYKYNKETMCLVSEYSQTSGKLYFDRQQILDENEHRELIRSIRKYFDHWGGQSDKTTLEQLREVGKVLGIHNNQKSNT